MPIQSRWSIPVPRVSLQKWLFGSPDGPLPDWKTFVETDDPSSRYLTYSDFRLWSKRIALGLSEAGLRPGDRVLLFSRNNLFYPPVVLGVLMAGGVFTGASTDFTSRELSHQLADSGAIFMLAATNMLDVAFDAAALAGLPTARIYAFDGYPTLRDRVDLRGLKHWSDLIAGEAEGHRFRWAEIADTEQRACCLNYSSGTTGLPKGVEISHYAYVAHNEMVVCHRKNDPGYNELDDPGSLLCFTPMYHAMGQSAFIFTQPKVGVTIYIMQRYSFEKLLQHAQDFKIRTLVCVPAVVNSLAKNPLRKKYDLSSVEQVACGTAPLAAETAREAERHWPGGDVYVRQGWGMTELTCTGTVKSPEITQPDDTVGEIAPNAAIKLLDSQGREIVQANTPGELWFTSPTLMKGYWRNPKATSETIVEHDGVRWLRTGDVAYVNKYGPGARLRLVDRMKELIKVKGFQVAPAELEAVILEHKEAADAGVVGVVIHGQELPRAYVCRTKDAGITESDIEKWVEGRVAKYKWLKGGVVLVDSIPRLQSGKILRRALRERARQETSGQSEAPPRARLA